MSEFSNLHYFLHFRPNLFLVSSEPPFEVIEQGYLLQFLVRKILKDRRTISSWSIISLILAAYRTQIMCLFYFAVKLVVYLVFLEYFLPVELAGYPS